MANRNSVLWSLGLTLGLLALAANPLPASAQGTPLLNKLENLAGHRAGTSEAGAGSAVDAEQLIQQQLAETEAALAEAGTGNEPPPGAEPSEVEQKRDILERLIISYRQQLARLRDIKDIKRYREIGADNNFGITPLPESNVYSFIAVDQLREAERSILKSRASLDASSAMLEKEYERNTALLQRAQAEARQAAERAETTKSAERLPRLRWLAGLAELKPKEQATSLALIDLERQVTAERRSHEDRRLEAVRLELARTQSKVVFSAEELTQVKANLEEEREALADEIEAATSASEAARTRLEEAEESLAAAVEGGENAADRDALERSVALRRAELENIVQSIRLLSLRITGLVREDAIWNHRWELSQAPSADAVVAASKAIESERDELSTWFDFIGQRRDQSQSLVVEHEGLTKRGRSPEESLHHMRLAELYRQRMGNYEDMQQALASYVRLIDFWDKDVEAARGSQPLRERLETQILSLWQLALQIWNYEVFTVEDQIEVEGRTITGQRGVTIGKFVSALLILGLGYWVSRWLSRGIEHFTVKRLGMEPSVARLARRWTEAVGLVVLVVIALALVKIPLTVFAFLGGAVAIGIGFGTQTLFKNLISGLMILFERPFHLDDLVEVGTVRGRVSDIGLRSSVVRDMQGIETLIPNSSFLEQNVTNWTYSNKRVRFSVQVGVAYGSDTRTVRDILLEVGARHGLVLKDPAPFVLFDDFGADALIFSLHFWLELVAHVDRWVVQSDLRFMIEEALSKAGITIAFPQRDVHLDTSRPLEIQMVSRADRGSGVQP